MDVTAIFMSTMRTIAESAEVMAMGVENITDVVDIVQNTAMVFVAALMAAVNTDTVKMFFFSCQ